MNKIFTSAEIRQSFLDFFKSKEHEVVRSAPLLPSSPNLLFTNAGMNQFVPYFLGERVAPYGRAADTQKCIRAGGKHNDLDDVGYDTYHQTFFEMLGNWSFGDYFKAEAIEWAWELLTGVWGFPKERLYASVYQPGEGDPAAFDEEAYEGWRVIFEAEGMDPDVHIVTGGKKDNFWMMGDTGPCGPCSELHVDLTPEGDSGGRLVNADSPFCIEIWNLVFIQFNASVDGSFVELAARHVDTGMGFERVAGIMATTRQFTDFSCAPSNYNSDLFSGIFKRISALCGRAYGGTLPRDVGAPSDVEMNDVVFRVLGDHVRTLCCSIADGILPGNEGRNYVLRRILRRAVMYGRRLDLKAGFFSELVEPVIDSLGDVFPELREQEDVVRKVIRSEEAAFDRTLDRGMSLFESMASGEDVQIPGDEAFMLYDTYGFPLDLTQILAEERGLSVDLEGFDAAMAKQKRMAQAAQKKSVIKVSEGGEGMATPFVGFDRACWVDFETVVVEVVVDGGVCYLVTEVTCFYAEMGGQVGDRGMAVVDGRSLVVVDTQRDGDGRVLHRLEEVVSLDVGARVVLSLDVSRRLDVQRHHSGTHVLHWALREVLGSHVRQAGSFVGVDRLRFDFNHFEALTEGELEAVERLCNERLVRDDAVRWVEVPFDDKPDDVIAFFGEKYGDVVRVVDMGGWSKELCGGTHVERTGELGSLRLVSESSVAAGVRRVEACTGFVASDMTLREGGQLRHLSRVFNVRADELGERVQVLLEQNRSLQKEVRQAKERRALGGVDDLLGGVKALNGVSVLAAVVEEQPVDGLRMMLDGLRVKLSSGVIVLGSSYEGKAGFVVSVSDDLHALGYHAGKLVGPVAKVCRGGGGGQAGRAQAGGKDGSKVAEAIAAVPELLASFV